MMRTSEDPMRREPEGRLTLTDERLREMVGNYERGHVAPDGDYWLTVAALRELQWHRRERGRVAAASELAEAQAARITGLVADLAAAVSDLEDAIACAKAECAKRLRALAGTAADGEGGPEKSPSAITLRDTLNWHAKNRAPDPNDPFYVTLQGMLRELVMECERLREWAERSRRQPVLRARDAR